MVVAAYEAAAGWPLVASRRAVLREQAQAVLATGRPVEWVAARAAEMPAKNWTDLLVHCQKSPVPVPGAASPAAAPFRRENCPLPGHGAFPADACSECEVDAIRRETRRVDFDPQALIRQMRKKTADAAAARRGR
ncbi:hypothetical protein ACQEVS_32980 [Streptomyces sp. CA-181903]|uniref:hypothetical protein n=1 Tax=Streptomyces sp. CA-181903 TaxID=3240055 RepID=UPI003D926991